MASCTTENWTLEDLASALQDMHKDNKRISVPMFQRGKRWNKEQQRTFIDSLIKGFPVGTMLFYETFDEGKQTYILVDGLQRGNSIRMYMSNPTEFFYDSSISDDFCQSVLQIVNANVPDNFSVVRSILTEFIKKQKTFKNLQYYRPAMDICERFSGVSARIEELINVIATFFEERQSLYDQVALTVIPVIVYHGDEENLPEIFDRINSKGTPLDPYEVYAAAWPVNKRFQASNIHIVEYTMRKYDSFVEDGFFIHGYDRENMRTSKQVTAFEYLFGLGKYLVNTYEILGFPKERNLPDDTVTPLGFELVNACLNDTDRIKKLYENIYEISNVDLFESALYKAIDFVSNSISVITRFKGNSRSGAKIFHPKYLIISMISTTFKEMFENRDYSKFSSTWENRKQIIEKNLRLYYVHDIITNYWSEGGTSKIYSAAKPNRYAIEISPRAWRTALEGFFEKSMRRMETKNIPNPKSEDYVIMNCIYLNTFTALDQLSINKFDVEHIAPKEQMRQLISKTNGSGLPISCIANLCYLPEYINRSKRSKNFYQDSKYLQHVNLEEIERKYSFTTKDDLEWMDRLYEGSDDFEALQISFIDFCNSRFEKIKRLFCESMGIDFIAINAPEELVGEDDITEEHTPDVKNATLEYVKKFEERTGKSLKRISRKAYMSSDGKTGYVFCDSKAYSQGNKEKYWFAYRKTSSEQIALCQEKHIVYYCKNADIFLSIPVNIMESILPALNFSKDDDGNITHWHIVFLRSNNGQMVQLLSKPTIQEIPVNTYIV